MKPAKDVWFCFQMGLVFAFAAVGFAFTNCFSHQFALKCFRGAGFNQNRFRTLGPARKNDSKTKETQAKQRKRKQNKGNASKTKGWGKQGRWWEGPGWGEGWDLRVLLSRAFELLSLRFRERGSRKHSLSRHHSWELEAIQKQRNP